MTLFGKILAALNVLAAVGFVALAAMDYGKRQAWSYAVSRYDWALDGLPLDNDQLDPTDGVKLVDKMAPNTAEELFSGNQPVKTQEDEVQRVRQQLGGEIERAGDESAKRRKLDTLLAPLATTGSERDDLRQSIYTAKPDELMSADGPFERTFNEVLARKGAKGDQRDPAKERRAIAHLLLNLGQDQANEANLANWHRRVVIVIGLKVYADEANRQAEAFAEMTGRVQVFMAEDRAAFEARHRAVISQLRVLAERLNNRQAELALQQNERSKHQVLVNERQQVVKQLEEDLKQASVATKKALEDLTQEQALLLRAQSAVGEGQATNEKLLRDIRQREGLERNGK